MESPKGCPQLWDPPPSFYLQPAASPTRNSVAKIRLVSCSRPPPFLSMPIFTNRSARQSVVRGKRPKIPTRNGPKKAIAPHELRVTLNAAISPEELHTTMRGDVLPTADPWLCTQVTTQSQPQSQATTKRPVCVVTSRHVQTRLLPLSLTHRHFTSVHSNP